MQRNTRYIHNRQRHSTNNEYARLPFPFDEKHQAATHQGNYNSNKLHCTFFNMSVITTF